MSQLGAKLAAIALALGAVCQPLAAAPRPVTLEQARAAAAAAPARRAARSRTAAAAGAVRAAGAWPATSVGVSTTSSTERLGVVASLPLPLFGTLGASRDVARADLDVTRAEESSVAGDLERDVTRAWLQLALAEAVASLSQRAAKRRAELLAVARARFDAGDAPRLDVVTAEAASARARAEADSDVAAIAGASAELAALLGWDPTAPLHAAGGIPALEPVPPLAALRRRRGGHPRARVAAARVGAGRARVAAAQAARWPALSLDLESLFDDPTLPGNDYRVGLTLELPLFGKGGAARDAAAAERRAAEVERDAALADLDGAIVAAYAQFRAAAARARALAGEVLPAQRRAAELARTAYREGQAGQVSVIEAERALTDAEARSAAARAGAAMARAELEWASGGRL